MERGCGHPRYKPPRLTPGTYFSVVTANPAHRSRETRKRGASLQWPAPKAGPTASDICRLEDADYEGHSLSTLRRIPSQLGREVKIVFVAIGRGRATA